MPSRPHLFLVIALIVSSFATASADELGLRNGDRYSGKVLELSGGMLKFDTGHGTVNVPWSDVATIDVVEPLMVTVRYNPPHFDTLRSVEGGGIVLEPDEFLVPVEDIVRLARVQPLLIGGDANAGLQASGGNTDANSMRMDGELIARTMENRYTVNAVVTKASNHGVLTDDKATGSLRYDRFFNPTLYGNVNALLTHDQFRGLRLRTAVGIALGYQVLDNPRVRLGTEAGYGYVDERFASAPDDRYQAARDSVRLDIFIIGQRLSLFHRHDGFFGLVGNNRRFVQTRNGVRVVLVGGLVATVSYDVDYDRTAPPGRKRTDHTAGLTFGYRFGTR